MKTAMILAAGRGERLRPLTDTLPKPLIPLAGKPLIIHLIERLARNGIKHIVINIAYRREQIKNALGDGKSLGVQIDYSEETEALETAGGIIHALPLLGNQPFLAISADIWTDYPFATLFQRQKNLGHLILVPNPAWHPTGDFSLDARGELLNKPQWTYANIGLFHPDFFKDYLPGWRRLRDLFSRGIALHQLTGEVYHGSWFNISDEATLREAEQFLAVSPPKH